jgi:hypothetical protein
VPAFAAIGGIDNNVMTARIMINHRNFMEREYQDESAMANEKGAAVESAVGRSKRQTFFETSFVSSG